MPRRDLSTAGTADAPSRPRFRRTFPRSFDTEERWHLAGASCFAEHLGDTLLIARPSPDPIDPLLLVLVRRSSPRGRRLQRTILGVGLMRAGELASA